MSLLLRGRAVLNPARYDYELAGVEDEISVTEFHYESPFDHQEHFVLVFMVVPDKLAVDLYELYNAVVDFAGDFWAPTVAEASKAIREVDLLNHDLLL